MRYHIVFIPEKCSACGACSMACMDQNDIDLKKGQWAFRWPMEYENYKKSPGDCAYLSISCRHCEDAPCIAACPTGSVKRDYSTGMVVYDQAKCIGCHSCSMACPFGIPGYSPENGRMQKCDGCYIRLQNNLKPACVNACSFGALLCLNDEEFRRLQKDKALFASIKAINNL